MMVPVPGMPIRLPNVWRMWGAVGHRIGTRYGMGLDQTLTEKHAKHRLKHLPRFWHIQTSKPMILSVCAMR